MSLSGRIARRRAVLHRDRDDRLLLRWRGRAFDLAQAVVRHRDDEGEITFTVNEPGGTGIGARYRRRGPRALDLVVDEIDPTNDEPWTWEDRDFGLRIFNIATGIGPVKYRHRIDPRRPMDPPVPHVVINDDGLVRRRSGARTENIRFSSLDEIRAKFELGGAWSAWAVLVLHAPEDVAVVPVASEEQVDRARSELLPRLHRLPGWDADADAAFEDACRYGLHGPEAGEDFRSRAERPVWARL